MNETPLPLADLIARYDRPGPRYTSYPTAVEFHDGVDRRRLRRAPGAGRRAARRAAVALRAPAVLRGALRLLRLQRGDHPPPRRRRALPRLPRSRDRPAGRAPAAAAAASRSSTGAAARRPTTRPSSSSASSPGSTSHFALAPEAEIGLEIDPRVTTAEQLTTLRRLGFNRLSMGVQDFAPEVQEAVNRIQSYEQTRTLVDHARAVGFRSLNIDLIYGLPYQTEDGLPADARPGRRPAPRAGRRLLVRLRPVDGRAHEAAARGGPARAGAQDRAARPRPACLRRRRLPSDRHGPLRAARGRARAGGRGADAAPQLHGLHRAIGARHGGGRRLGHRRRPGTARPEHQEADRVLRGARRRPLPHRARLRPRRGRRPAPPRDHRADVQRPPRRPRGRAPLRRHLRRLLRAGAGRAGGARRAGRPTAWCRSTPRPST